MAWPAVMPHHHFSAPSTPSSPFSTSSLFNTTALPLPAHCAPSTPFLHFLSSHLATCLPTPLALLSTTLGTLSILAWLCAQLPQIWKNYSLQSTSGLSVFFLVEWCLGDVANLLGATFTHQAPWQVVIGAYYVAVDLALVAQWVWYERLGKGRAVFRVRRGRHHHHHSRKHRDEEGQERRDYGTLTTKDDAGASMNGAAPAAENDPVDADGKTATESSTTNTAQSRPRMIFRTPTFAEKDSPGASSSPSSVGGSSSRRRSGGLSTTPGGTPIYRVGSGAPMPSPSPRTVLLIACLIAVVAGSPVPTTSPTTSFSSSSSSSSSTFSWIHLLLLLHRRTTTDPTPLTPLELTGSLLAWLSTLLYLASRLPQLYKNYRRKSTAGLSPHLFLAAFAGNLFYSAALLTNPNVWYDVDTPYGGGGWVGPDGNDRVRFIVNAAPFFLGAAGVLGLDASVGVQFWLYGAGRGGKGGEVLVVVQEEQAVLGETEEEEEDGTGGVDHSAAAAATAAGAVDGPAEEIPGRPIRPLQAIAPPPPPPHSPSLSASSTSSAAGEEGRRHWRRVQGWMRGWMPSSSFSLPSATRSPLAVRAAAEEQERRGEREALMGSVG